MQNGYAIEEIAVRTGEKVAIFGNSYVRESNPAGKVDGFEAIADRPALDGSGISDILSQQEVFEMDFAGGEPGDAEAEGAVEEAAAEEVGAEEAKGGVGEGSARGVAVA